MRVGHTGKMFGQWDAAILPPLRLSHLRHLARSTQCGPDVQCELGVEDAVVLQGVFDVARRRSLLHDIVHETRLSCWRWLMLMVRHDCDVGHGVRHCSHVVR